mgnify:CR=1 FL=1
MILASIVDWLFGTKALEVETTNGNITEKELHKIGLLVALSRLSANLKNCRKGDT